MNKEKRAIELAQEGKFEECFKMVEELPYLIHDTNECRGSILGCAISGSNESAALRALDLGAHPFHRNVNGESHLFNAIRFKLKTVAHRLVDMGVPLDKRYVCWETYKERFYLPFVGEFSGKYLEDISQETYDKLLKEYYE